jgi:hypothetical protein
MFNKGKFYSLAKDLRETLGCKQETAEYLAALYQWAEEGLSNESYELQREASALRAELKPESQLVDHH